MPLALSVLKCALVVHSSVRCSALKCAHSSALPKRIALCSALECAKCTPCWTRGESAGNVRVHSLGCMRVHLDYRSALGCLECTRMHESTLRCVVHLDYRSALGYLECTRMHESALGL